jgi:streptogramin lyase
MKLTTIKPFLYTAIFVITSIIFITACTKKNITPNDRTSTGTDSLKADSISKVDSLPSFNSPTGIALDAAGNIYVADYGNNLIRKITSSGIVSTIAGTGMQGAINATGVLASFSRPTSLALDAAGNIYVADGGNNLIRKITTSGVVTTFAGTDTTGTIDGPGLTASFYDPLGVALDGQGNVYVADAGNNLIRLISPAGVVSTLAGNNNTVTSNGTLSANSFNNPTGVAVDGNGNIYVANYLNSNILQITGGNTVNVFAGSGQIGNANGQGAAASFYFPNNVAVDAANNVYVSDGVNDLIRKITPDGTVSTLAGSGAAGAADSTGTAATFNGPAGLAVDATGNVFVADANNNLIRKITPLGIVTTVAGNGQAGAKNGQVIAYHKRALKLAAKSRFKIWSNK